MNDTTLIISLIIAGYALVFAELLLPGMIAGTIGIACLIAGTIWSFSHFGNETGFYILLGELVSGIILFILWSKYFFISPLGKRFVIGKKSQQKSASQKSSTENFQHLLNKEGIALSYLRPVGTARIDGSRYDVITEGSLIEENSKIQVIKIDGINIVVRKI